MNIERSTEREFGIYNVTNDKFHNLNYSNPFEDVEEFEQTPTDLFTYEECQRYIVHKEDPKVLTILNLKQPKYLLEFSLEVVRKEYHDRMQKEHLAKSSKMEDAYKQATSSAIKSNSTKLNFMQALANWDSKLNSPSVQASGRMEEVYKQRPKMEDYGLTFESFNETEKATLKSTYKITE